MSRYKFDRSSEFIPGDQVVGGQWRGRGIRHYRSVMVAGAKAKTVTNLLILLSVLPPVFYSFSINLFFVWY